MASVIALMAWVLFRLWLAEKRGEIRVEFIPNVLPGEHLIVISFFEREYSIAGSVLDSGLMEETGVAFSLL